MFESNIILQNVRVLSTLVTIYNNASPQLIIFILLYNLYTIMSFNIRYYDRTNNTYLYNYNLLNLLQKKKNFNNINDTIKILIGHLNLKIFHPAIPLKYTIVFR